jgi:phage terminase large subunit-like protein
MAPDKQHYHGWVRSGALRVSEGDVVDLILVTQEAKDAVKKYGAAEIAYDPWNTEQLSQEVAADTKAVPVAIRQNVAMLSAPTKELDVLITAERIHHDGNPVLSWNVGNVNGREDANENVFPQKQAGREEKKIDGAIALIMCIARLMAVKAVKKQSVYATRGLLRL